MSIYIGTGEDEPAFLSSNQGWTDFGEWADTLDAESFPLVVQLWEHGIAEPAGEVASQLEAAISQSPPKGTTHDTAEELLELLHGLEPDAAVAVNNGMTSSGAG